MDFSQRAPLLAEIVDDAGLRGADLARGRRVSRLEADDALRQLGFGEFDAERVDNVHIAEPEQWARLDLDDDRGSATIAISFGGAREGCDVARPDRQACTVDRDRHRRVVVARAPQRVDDRREVALGASRESFAIGWGVPWHAVER